MLDDECVGIMQRRRLTRVVCATAAVGVLCAGLVVAPAHAEGPAVISEHVLETAREANSSFSDLHEDIVTERQAGGIEAISPLAATA